MTPHNPKHFLYWMLLFLGWATLAQAQTPACARLLLGSGQDSLTWQASTCPGFGGYVVLAQVGGTGPFVRLDTFTLPQAVLPNPLEEPINYQVGVLCNGALTNVSVTVSNQKPITPDLLSVNIVNNIPVVRWSPSPSPEVTGYQVYKEQPYGSGNYFPYPNATTIINTTSYTDASATDLLARYAILAVSRCNESVLGLGNASDGTTGPHTSMVVEGTLSACEQTVTLNWNAYENWREGVEAYEVWLSRNGTPFQRVEVLPGTATSYVYENAQDGEVLAFQIRAQERTRNNTALSNIYNLTVAANRPMDFIHLTELTVNDNTTVELAWEWDTDVDYQTGDVLRSPDSSQWSSRLVLPVLGSSANTFTDSPVEADQEVYFYQIRSEDACGQVVLSNAASTILLQVTAIGNFTNEIAWTPARAEGGTVQQYWLYKTVGNNTERIAILPADQTTYRDVLDVTDESQATACYSVLANVAVQYANGNRGFFQSRSNSACATQGSDIQVPNALAPEGENRIFRPVVVFGRSIRQYQLVIYNRHGALLFESNDLNEGWDGTHQGRIVPLGAYVYRIQYLAPNGTAVERRGTVMVVR